MEGKTAANSERTVMKQLSAGRNRKSAQVSKYRTRQIVICRLNKLSRHLDFFPSLLNFQLAVELSTSSAGDDKGKFQYH